MCKHLASAWFAISTSIVFASIVFVSGCETSVVEQSEPTRGLRAFVVDSATQSVVRRYPSIIKPHDETRLAFEVGGQLRKVTLVEGQKVRSNDVLLRLDPSTFQLRVQETQAGVNQADATYRNARANFERQSELWQKRVIPRAGFDDAQATVDSAQAQLQQARKRLELAQDDLSKTQLRAPFDGTIASIEVESFANVAAGQRTLTLYAQSAFETAFSVPSSVINFLSLGQDVEIRVSDLTDREFTGRITELGSRATEVSAFPIVALLDDPPNDLKSGMSAEVEVAVPLPQNIEGLLIPITCFAFNTVKQLNPERTGVPVFVYDQATKTVRSRTVDVVGVRENMVIVRNGLNPGDIVASAGVSYLRDGQRVQLLEND